MFAPSQLPEWRWKRPCLQSQTEIDVEEGSWGHLRPFSVNDPNSAAEADWECCEARTTSSSPVDRGNKKSGRHASVARVEEVLAL